MLTYCKQVQEKLQVLSLPVYISKHSTALYFHASIRMFCTLFICYVSMLFFVIDLFSNVFLIWVIDFFQTFDYFTFVNTFLISCWLHYVNIFASHLGTDYMSNWFTFGLPRCSKNKPGLKMFLVLYYEKCIRSITGLKADQK